MESEPTFTSSSGSSSSTSSTSSSSSDSDEETLEPVKILNHSLELPPELCENYKTFKEFFSINTWNSLEDKHKEHLNKFLPTFKENDKEEKEKTLNMLFNREPFHFTSPLNQFFGNLKQGNYRPDIAKMKKFLLKARAKQQKQKLKSYYAKLLPEVLISRERLLTAFKTAPPGPLPRLSLVPPKPSHKSNHRSPHVRAKQRYFEELAAIRSEVGGSESEDENYPGGFMVITKKRRQIPQNTDGNILGTLGGSEPSPRTTLSSLKNILSTHKARRQYREEHPELDTTGITLEEIKQRVAMVNGTRKTMFGTQKPVESPIKKLRRNSKKEKLRPDIKPPKIAKLKQESESSESNIVDSKPLSNAIKAESTSDIDVVSFVEPKSSPKVNRKVEKNELKLETIMSEDSSNLRSSPLPFKQLKKEVLVSKPEPIETSKPPVIQSSTVQPLLPVQPVPIKLEDLDGIDMMALPIELAEGAGGESSLMQRTHSSFFSVVRALFPARAAHRASPHQLRTRCNTLMKSPIAALNTWYTLSDNWCSELDSALEFLAGNQGQHPDDYVPYLQFLPDTQTYQWIGAGRDCDANLGRLCDRWLRSRCAPVSAPHPVHADVPSARYRTNWVVRPPTTAELFDFREQERRRFSSAAKPFTYIQHGYKSSVGPWTVRAGACAAQAAVLRSDRPRHATFTALLRDAVARLPNGEGSKHDIVTLLKMSQWIAPCSDQLLSSAVSSALERLSNAKRDPVVKFDHKSNTWVYLFRHRNEEDWLKIGSSRSRAKNAAARAHKQLIAAAQADAMEMEVSHIEEVVDVVSDSDVDVDDSGTGYQPLGPSIGAYPSLGPISEGLQASGPTGKDLLIQAQQNAGIKTGGKTGSLLDDVGISGTTILQPQPTPPISIVHTPTPPPKTKPQPKSTPTQPQTSLNTTPTRTKPITNPTVNNPPIPIISPVSTPNRSLPPPPLTPTIPKPPTAPRTILPSTRAIISNPRPSLTPTRTIISTPKTTTISTKTPISSPRTIISTPKSIAPTSRATIISPRGANATSRNIATTLLPVPTLTPANVPKSSQSVVKASVKQRIVTPNAEGLQSLSQVTTAASPTITVVTPASTTPAQNTKLVQATRSLLLRPTNVQTVATAPSTSAVPTTVCRNRRGVVRVLSPAVPSAGKSLISPRALMTNTTGSTTASVPVKRKVISQSTPVATVVQQNATTLGSSAPTIVTPSIAGTRTVQLSNGRTVQLATGHALQLSSLHLTGHTVKLPSGQSVQLAGQTVQLAGQTVQLATATGHTVQLPSGQTLQLSGGQQTLQLANGQTVHLTGQVPKPVPHMVRTQGITDKAGQPIVAKILSNPQGGQMISLDGGRTLQLANVRPQGPKTLQTVQGVRVVSTGQRGARPLLLTSAKPIHNLVLGDPNRSTPAVSHIVLGNIGGQSVTTTSPTPVLKLQQVNPLQQLKLSQGIKIQQTTTGAAATSTGAIRNVVMDGQQIKLVSGKHVLARILRPTHPP